LGYLNKILNPKDTAQNVPYKYDVAALMGQTYQEINDLPNASLFTEMAVREFTKKKDTIYWINSLNNNAKIKIKKGNFLEAKNDLDLAKVLLKDQKITVDFLDVYQTQIEYYKKIKNYELALKAIEEQAFYQRKYTEKTNLANLAEQDIRYQTEKKEQQIKLLSAQNELARKQNYTYIGLLVLLLLLAGSAFYGLRNKIKTAQKLKELNELKSRFFANISHEFRTPLTLIKSPVQSLLSEIPDGNQKNKLQLIDTNSTRMLELVDQLLELSKIDSGNLKLIIKDGNISSLLHSIVEPFQFQAKEKGINFNSNIQKTEEKSAFDRDVIEKIVTNLVSNAFKYSPQNESISFRSSVENSNLQLIVSNTGSDVKKEDLPKLFERFYQKNELKQGVGIGLALVKELVDLYDGTISTAIENGELSFILTLPLAVSNENAVVIPAKAENTTIENSIPNDTEIPVLLIVDDNPEIRAVLRDIFKNDYQIIEAQDGEEALQLAQKEIPDCIISDVMMPNTDGFEFTKQIKNNELTSFIPVILLTAKTSNEAHLEGLKSTADAFLTKPFNNDIVKATVNQLITERRKLHLRYSQELVLKPVDIVINSVEEKFIVKLQDILEKELSNSEFSSEDFASAVGMSRMQLHRKLKSLLGVSATEFLRNERLKAAADLLKKGNGNISEIAYAVGFNDVSYFSKCFKEMFSVTPSDYLNSRNTP
jgi:signal transduction histidine kinase/DNA-binding response OmpR family regulator